MAAPLFHLGLGTLERSDKEVLGTWRQGVAWAKSLHARELHGGGELFSGHRKQGWGSQLAECGVSL